MIFLILGFLTCVFRTQVNPTRLVLYLTLRVMLTLRAFVKLKMEISDKFKVKKSISKI